MKKFHETQLSNFQARYGQEIPDNDFPTNMFVENILKRKTIRRFDTNRPVDPKLMEKLIATAQSAPTSSNLQTWSVISVRSLAGKNEIIKPENHVALGITPRSRNPDGSIKDGPLNPGNDTAILECDTVLLWMVECNFIEEIITNPETYKMHPDLLPLKEKSLNGWYTADLESQSIIDVAIAAQTLCVAAESIGLGVMYCGALRHLDFREYFNVPSRACVLFGMCVGWPTPVPLNPFGQVKENLARPEYIKPRLPQELVFHKETYNNIRMPNRNVDDARFQKLKEYNALIKEFYQIHFIEGDWFERAVKRIIRPIDRFKLRMKELNFYKD